MYPDINEGGMGFVNINCNAKALFLDELIKLFEREGPNQNIIKQWVGKIKLLKKTI